GAAAGGIFRDRQLDRTAKRRHPHLAAEHGLIERDRQLEPDVGPVDLEERVRGDVDGDEQIAGLVTLRGLALPAKADLLAGDDACRNLDIKLLAVRQPHALLAALDRLLQRHRHRHLDVEIKPDAAGVVLERAATTATLAGAARSGRAEHAVEDILEI